MASFLNTFIEQMFNFYTDLKYMKLNIKYLLNNTN